MDTVATIDPARFRNWHQQFRNRFEQEITRALDRHLAEAPDRLSAAIRHAALDGGKRLRPLLSVLACHMGDTAAQAGTTRLPDIDAPALNAVWPAAIAIELIHVYSLIHDDLPSMDDDDLRRGRPTVHRAFDEATAILAGDALQALAFQTLAEAPVSTTVRLDWVTTLAKAAGPVGMVGGQQTDLDSERQNLPLESLKQLHDRKTGMLIRAALTMGAAAAGLPEALGRHLDQFGRELGLAFQIQDDILDVTGSADTLGKTPGKDAAADKSSFVSLLGLEGARSALQATVDKAQAQLTPMGNAADALSACAHFVMTRSN